MAVKKATSATTDGLAPKPAATTKGAARARASAKPAARPTTKSTLSVAAAKGGKKSTSTKAASIRSTTATKSTAKSAANGSTAKSAVTRTASGRTATTRSTTKSPATKGLAAAGPLRAHKVAASTSTAAPQRLRVRQDETPWTAKELKQVRTGLEVDIARLRVEISSAESDLAGLMRDAGDGAGDDQADAGTKTFEREQEISLANNAREMFDQSQHALGRIIDGTYGTCESCGNAIGKNRLLAFPRATLCMPCKSKQERR